ncbi:MAG TPA: patatin-like phospholipase family protein [Fimbriimonadaceae bacterium]|jgi:patatin-like phospholipase/acyl hydrolase
MPKYRILSIDGGGIRGVLTAALLDKLNTAAPTFLPNVDLFAGTSTGALLAAGLAKGNSPKQMEDLYVNQGPGIFKDPNPFDAATRIDGVARARYPGGGRLNAISSVFKNITLDDLPKKIIIATFDLDDHLPPPTPANAAHPTWKAKFYHNFPGADSDGAEKVTDVLMRSSAAPTYFPIYQNHVDGGMVANNPSMCALAQALDPVRGPGVQLDDIVILSVGTGANPDFIASEDGDWGLLQWKVAPLNMMMDGSAGLADYQCGQILTGRYFRLQIDLPGNIGLDDASQIQNLIGLASSPQAQAQLQAAATWLGKNW